MYKEKDVLTIKIGQSDGGQSVNVRPFQDNILLLANVSLKGQLHFLGPFPFEANVSLMFSVKVF